MARYRNIARVARPHGRRGEVLVHAVRGLPLALRPGMRVALTPPALDRDRFCEVEHVSVAPDGVIARFSGIADITAAEGICGCMVLADDADLELGPLDVAVDELVGREVADAALGSLGAIEEVLELPANDVWVVRGARFGEVLVPVVEAVVPAIPDEGPIAVDLPGGLVKAGEGRPC